MKADINEKIKQRGKIQVHFFENYYEKYPISSNKMIDIIKYKNNKELLENFKKNIDSYKYFNVMFFNYDNKEDAFGFLKSFIEYNDDDCIVKNNSDYPFFVFFKKKNFNKELLYSYYLENTKEMDISSFYEIKSLNIKFIEDSTDEINNLLINDITNYFYEYDFKTKNNAYNIEFLFMGQTGCGKSTFINYLLGKLRAYSSSTSTFKSRGGVYTHSKYPIAITDSEGFEVSDSKQQEKIFKKLEKNIDEELNNRTHLAFYLIPGPYNSNRDFDYSIIGPLLKLEQYHILYYVIMTKDPEETKSFAKTSKRFLTSLIDNRDFEKVTHDFKNEDLLVQTLEKIKNKLENRIFSVDVLKKNSKTISQLFNQISQDLNVEKKNNEDFIRELEKDSKSKGSIEVDFSGDSIINDTRFNIPKTLENSPFFNLNKVNNNADKFKRAKNIIEEAKDVSSIRKIFFCYNSKIVDNRKKMVKEIVEIYDCPNLSIKLIEEKLSNKEKDEWFYQHDCTDDLGKKIINICEEEYKKTNIVNKYINYCTKFINSIKQFESYKNELLNFKLNGEKILYDCELTAS